MYHLGHHHISLFKSYVEYREGILGNMSYRLNIAKHLFYCLAWDKADKVKMD